MGFGLRLATAAERGTTGKTPPKRFHDAQYRKFSPIGRTPRDKPARISGSRPVWDDVALEDVARAIIDDLDAELVATRARILVDAPVTLRGSPTLLRALLQNLVANSVKFGHVAGIAPEVEIRAQRLSGGWRITVDDNGPGIPSQARDQVFDLMDRGSAEGVPGLGIGLSTCRRVVDAHGGRIGIADSPLGGAQVWVVLPLAMN